LLKALQSSTALLVLVTSLVILLAPAMEQSPVLPLLFQQERFLVILLVLLPTDWVDKAEETPTQTSVLFLRTFLKALLQCLVAQLLTLSTALRLLR
jgi:hypothetical protein